MTPLDRKICVITLESRYFSCLSKCLPRWCELSRIHLATTRHLRGDVRVSRLKGGLPMFLQFLAVVCCWSTKEPDKGLFPLSHQANGVSAEETVLKSLCSLRSTCASMSQFSSCAVGCSTKLKWECKPTLINRNNPAGSGKHDVWSTCRTTKKKKKKQTTGPVLSQCKRYAAFVVPQEWTKLRAKIALCFLHLVSGSVFYQRFIHMWFKNGRYSDGCLSF